MNIENSMTHDVGQQFGLVKLNFSQIKEMAIYHIKIIAQTGRLL